MPINNDGLAEDDTHRRMPSICLGYANE